MKKILFLSLLFVAIIIGFSSCNDDDPSFLGANVTIKVTNLAGVPQAGKAVYMYKDAPVTNETVPGNARKMVVTDENGIARFNLNLTELNILESQTKLYSAVFYTLGTETVVADSEAVTVKRNQSKDVEIVIPL